MSEAKPTKAKWWNRSRPHTPDGDFELAAPQQPSAEGDFTLPHPAEAERPRPAADLSRATDDVPPPRPAAEQEGDPEPPRPAPSPQARDTGDYELHRPEATPTGSGPRPAAEPGTVPHPSAAPEPTPAGLPGPEAQPVDGAAPGPYPHPGGPGTRPTPLHDPDPYSTPPYGEPGPWAPAPPVQHPAATAPPAGGTGIAPPPPGDVPPAGVNAPAVGGVLPAVDPWGRYDPWAVAAGPFQQNGAPVLTQKQERRRARKGLIVAILLIALASGAVGGLVGAHLERNGGVGTTVTLPQAGREPAGRAADSIAGIAGRALPSVVTLHVSGSDAAGTGTGFVLDAKGHILTNNHVVRAAGEGGRITVTFNSGDTATATVVGRDSGYDLAVVKVTGVRGLTPLPLGNSDNVRVGDPVVAIGAPFDLAGTVTSGIISARQRPITAGGEDSSDVSYVDALQTDAPINPGNSGGPLLDSRGRAIGINSAIRSAGSGSGGGDGEDPDGGQAGSIGLGFAIPINQGKRVAEELINTGRATHPVIGINLDMDYAGDGARVGDKDNSGGPAVVPGGAGARAGLRPGDVITRVDGDRVHSGEELIIRTRSHRPGDRLELTLTRGGKETKVSLVLGSSAGS
ncbi:trypsin-like peptidase domain-containing protein [Streptomyces sp. NPDC003717]|uniref:trypsin-like peptidase domain-containing protein n=1 Tax=Streptomyces sp. NPDC003717 TaxID=3154276 RepID=UPI0033B974C4